MIVLGRIWDWGERSPRFVAVNVSCSFIKFRTNEFAEHRRGAMVCTGEDWFARRCGVGLIAEEDRRLIAGADWAGNRWGDRATGRWIDWWDRRLGDWATRRWIDWGSRRLGDRAAKRLVAKASGRDVATSPAEPNEPVSWGPLSPDVPGSFQLGKATLHVAGRHSDLGGNGDVAREAMILEPRPLTDQGDYHELGRGRDVGVREDLVDPGVGPAGR